MQCEGYAGHARRVERVERSLKMRCAKSDKALGTVYSYAQYILKSAVKFATATTH